MVIQNRILGSVSVLLSVGLLCFVLAPKVHASVYNEKTVVTVSGPVEVPGHMLPAGTYVFQLANPASGPQVLRITNKKTGNEVGLFFMAPIYRWMAPQQAIVTLQERPTSSPPALGKWFYPGTHRGLKFLYAHPQWQSMAALKHTSKFATKG